jgi:flagellar biosynthesis protein FlhA
VRILDNMRLPNQGYAIRIKEMEAGAGRGALGSLMAMDPPAARSSCPAST